MKILFLLRIEVIPSLGGVERVTHLLTQFLLKKGIEVSYLYYGINSITDNKFHSNLKVYFLPNSDIYRENENILFIQKILINEKINILINQSAINNKFANILAKSVKNTPTRIISVLHNAPFKFEQYNLKFNAELVFHRNNLILIFKKFFTIFFSRYYYYKYSNQLRLTYEFSSIFLLLSERFSPTFSAIINIKNPLKIRGIPNPSSFKIQKNIFEKVNTVLYVGRLEYSQKRIDRLICAWGLIEKNNPDWQLLIIGGDGGNPNEKEQITESIRLNKIVTKLNLKNIKFLGRQDPQIFYEKSKILCLTSSYEGWPLVLNEAMQYGVVPVAFGSYESVYDIINNKINGVIVKPFDVEQYAKELEKLMLNPKILTEMSLNAIEKSKQYDIDIIGNKWLSLFDEILLNE